VDVNVLDAVSEVAGSIETASDDTQSAALSSGPTSGMRPATEAAMPIPPAHIPCPSNDADEPAATWSPRSPSISGNAASSWRNSSSFRDLSSLNHSAVWRA
jgi:hypothetical protein